MTPAEVSRYVESRQRVMKREAKEQAARDWTLADLIGRSVSRIYSKDAKLPEVWEAYPALFSEERERIVEEREKRQDELSAQRFKQFAQSFNKKLNKEVAKLNE